MIGNDCFRNTDWNNLGNFGNFNWEGIFEIWNADDADLTDGRGLFFGLLCDYIGFAKAKKDGD